MGLKTFKEIVDAMLNTAKTNSDGKLTDTNRGSVNRTLLEGVGVQLADQSIQLSKIKDTFSIDKAKGVDLDNRAQDYGKAQARRQPKGSVGTAQVGDSAVTYKFAGAVLANNLAGVSSLTLTAAKGTQYDATGAVVASVVALATAFPAGSYVILDRDVPARRERCLVIGTSGGGSALTFSAPTTKAHDANATVILSQQGVDHLISTGTVAYVSESETVDQLNFETTADATLLDGEVVVPVAVKSQGVGLVQNIGEGLLKNWTNAPWGTATITNFVAFSGGRNLETDAQMRDRLRLYVQALSAGPAPAIKAAALSVELETGPRVVSAQVVEAVTPGDPSYLYIDDGDGTASTTANADTAVLTNTGDTGYGTRILMGPAASETGQRRFKLGTWPVVANTLCLYKSTLRDTIAGFAGTVVTFVGSHAANSLNDLFILDSSNHLFKITNNSGGGTTANIEPVSSGAANPSNGACCFFSIPMLWAVSPVAQSQAPLVLGTDYNFNETTGDIELATGLTAGDGLLVTGANSDGTVPAFVYYTGLIAEVQKVENGDPSDLDNYPGVRASGVKLIVTAPSVLSVDIGIAITAPPGVDESTLIAPVQEAILAYVNGLGIGENVIIAQIIAVAMGVDGVTDAAMVTPTGNVTVLDGYLARTTNSQISVV